MDNNLSLVYLIIIFLAIEWFYNHPALRYGGYHIIALLFFIPLSVKLNSLNITQKRFTIISTFLIFITSIVFISRNINRIINEVEFYGYSPIKETYYSVNNEHFRIQNKMDQIIEKYNNCTIMKIDCSKDYKVKMIMNKIIFTY